MHLSPFEIFELESQGQDMEFRLHSDGNILSSGLHNPQCRMKSLQSKIAQCTWKCISGIAQCKLCKILVEPSLNWALVGSTELRCLNLQKEKKIEMTLLKWLRVETPPKLNLTDCYAIGMNSMMHHNYRKVWAEIFWHNYNKHVGKKLGELHHMLDILYRLFLEH